MASRNTNQNDAATSAAEQVTTPDVTPPAQAGEGAATPRRTTTRKPRTPKPPVALIPVPQQDDKKDEEAAAPASPQGRRRNSRSGTARQSAAPKADEPKGGAEQPTAEQPKPADEPTPAPEGSEDLSSPSIPIGFPEREKRNLVGRACSLLLVLALFGLAVLIFLFRPGRYDEKTNEISFLYQEATNVTQVAVNGTVIAGVTGRCEFSTHDASGDTAAAIIGGTLYLIDQKQLSEIAQGVNDCVLSSNGKALAWRTEDINLFYLAIGKREERYHMSSNTPDEHYALSPDGKELFYTFEKDGISRIDVYSRTGSKPYLLDNQSYYPVAVSNRCRYLYYTNETGQLSVLSTKTNETVLCCEEPQAATLIFNRDCTQMMAFDGERTRLFVDGKPFELPGLGVGERFLLQANRRAVWLPQQLGTRCMIESFFGNYYLHEKEDGSYLVYLERERELAVMAPVSRVDAGTPVTVCDKAVFFLETEQVTNATHTNLYRCKAGKTERESLCWDVQHYVTNVDGSRLLFVDVHGALFSLSVGMSPKRLCDTVVVESLRVTADDSFYFYRADGELCVSDNGEAPRVIANGVAHFDVEGMTLYYFVEREEGGYTAYSNYRNLRKSAMIAEGVTALA